MAVTTIQVSTDLLEQLKARKLYDKESYEEVIHDILEDTKELNEQTKKELAQSRAEIKAGKVHTLDHIKKKYRL
jgi:hypothetical protein